MQYETFILHSTSENTYNLLYTGCPGSKFHILRAYNSKTRHIRPYVGNAKMRFGGVNLFIDIVNKQLNNQNEFTPPEPILEFTNLWSIMPTYLVF